MSPEILYLSDPPQGLCMLEGNTSRHVFFGKRREETRGRSPTRATHGAIKANLRDLLQRLHRGSYRPQPGLRKNIPKGNGKTRPLGIACVEDKLVQRAVVMIEGKRFDTEDNVLL